MSRFGIHLSGSSGSLLHRDCEIDYVAEPSTPNLGPFCSPRNHFSCRAYPEFLAASGSKSISQSLLSGVPTSLLLPTGYTTQWKTFAPHVVPNCGPVFKLWKCEIKPLPSFCQRIRQVGGWLRAVVAEVWMQKGDGTCSLSPIHHA